MASSRRFSYSGLALAVAAAFFGCAAPGEAKGNFIHERKGSFRAKSSALDAAAFKSEIHNALGEVMGCGDHISQEKLIAIEQELTPMWQALPKNNDGRIERRLLRYLAHRYFNRRSALVVRGFEPSRPVNASNWGAADILSQQVPAYVENVLESQHRAEHGFDMKDAVYMVATLDQLIFDAESMLLERVYSSQMKPTGHPVTTAGAGQVLEEYMIHWMMSDDTEGVKILLANRSLLESAFPHWNELVDFAKGQIKAIDFKRQNDQTHSVKLGNNALTQRYSFNDVHEVVGGITKSFASYWESECQAMKAQLVEMDSQRTGRVPLSRFYGNGALDGEWRFAESEPYLREMGVLDETSAWRGKQVIIPNYLQAASNCIVSTPHYLVCCVNECEGLLGEIEAAIGAPLAMPSEILSLVANMTSQTTLDDDFPPQLEGSLTSQLEQIAAASGGRVPLHGRLFAQWLHYAFPWECPFPHKTGVAASVTPSEFGDNYVATVEDMKTHVVQANESGIPADVDKEELQWMSQWSEEEELISDYNGELRTSSWSGRGLSLLAVVLLLAGLFKGVATTSPGKMCGTSYGPGLLPTYGKAHFV